VKIEKEPTSWLQYHKRECQRRIANAFRSHHACSKTHDMSPAQRNFIDEECNEIARIDAELRRRGE